MCFVVSQRTLDLCMNIRKNFGLVKTLGPAAGNCGTQALAPTVCVCVVGVLDCPPFAISSALRCAIGMAGLRFDLELKSSHASVAADGTTCSFSSNDGTTLCSPTADSGSSRVRALALRIKQAGDYSAQVGMAPPSTDVNKGLHQQDGVCLWSGNVYINGVRKRVGVEAGPEPLLVWRMDATDGTTGTNGAWGGLASCTLTVYADGVERCRLPVPTGSTHFAVSGDINGQADFAVDVARMEEAQLEAEKGEAALAEWLRVSVEEAKPPPSSGGGCCVVA